MKLVKEITLPCGQTVSPRVFDEASVHLVLNVRNDSSIGGGRGQANGLIITRRSIPALCKWLLQFAPKNQRRKPARRNPERRH